MTAFFRITCSTILLPGFLAILTACNGQEKTTIGKVSTPPQNGPVVIKKNPAAAMPPNADTTLVSQYIRSIFQDSKGNLWFGTIEEGVVRYDANTLTYFSGADGFNCRSVFSINEDKKGNMWLGTDQGLYRFDGQTFRQYGQKDGLMQVDISRKSIVVDKTGQIWVGTHGGVYRYDPVAEANGGAAFSMFQPLAGINIAGIMEDRSGHLWFASSNKGVFRYDGKETINLAGKERLGDNYAGGMAQDAAGNMWFTMPNGICRYDGKTFKDYTAKDGLGGTEIWGLYIEQSGIIWVTARGSTTRFDPTVPLPDTNAFTVFTPDDGINCCVQSMYQDRSGHMWWGAGQGLFRFDGNRFYQVKKAGPW